MFFSYHDPATTEIYTLSLHDALPILAKTTTVRAKHAQKSGPVSNSSITVRNCSQARSFGRASRSEEHTSELQSRRDLVCRLLLEKKKARTINTTCTKRLRRGTTANHG